MEDIAARRPLRAAVIAAVSVAALLVGYDAVEQSESCLGFGTSDSGCVTGAVVFVLLGGLGAVLLIGWALRGRGAVHAVLGTFICLFGGFNGASAILGMFDASKVGEAVAVAVLTGGLAAGWAAFGPAQDSDFSRGSGA